MYIYTFKLKFAKRHATLTFNKYNHIFVSAVTDINDGLTFKRDGKTFQIEKIEETFLILQLKSRNSLKNPSRSIAALTRYLTKYHFDIFGDSIYNKTLFSIKLLSQGSYVSSVNPQTISNEDLLKGMIDLLYGSSMSNSDIASRNKTIQEIKRLAAPYIKKDDRTI